MNKSKGNMYDFVTHTWNPIKGKCSHDCSYCYMKRHPQKELWLDDKILYEDLGKDNFIFVGSATDIFAEDVREDFIIGVLLKCGENDGINKFLFQTKNPERLFKFYTYLPKNSIIGTTIESDDYNPNFMGKAPSPFERAYWMKKFKEKGFETMITIEPIMSFDLERFLYLFEEARPSWVNIGADSNKNKDLPEPSKEDILDLIEGFECLGICIKKKHNLERIFKSRGGVNEK